MNLKQTPIVKFRLRSIGEQLMILRESKHYTLQSMAKKAKMALGTIHKIEKGNGNLISIIRYADALEFDFEFKLTARS